MSLSIADKCKTNGLFDVLSQGDNSKQATLILQFTDGVDTASRAATLRDRDDVKHVESFPGQVFSQTLAVTATLDVLNDLAACEDVVALWAGENTRFAQQEAARRKEGGAIGIA